MSEDSHVRDESGQTHKESIASRPIEKEMRELVSEGSYLNQDAVYQRLSSALSIKEIEDKVKEDFAKDISERMIAEIRGKLGEDYVRLLIEPSVSTRFDDFIVFAKRVMTQQEGIQPWEVRNKFRDSLGKKMVYRVSTATSEDLENILTNGFLANYYRNRPAQTLLKNEDGYESMEYALTDLRGRVNIHAGFFDITKDSMFISVSEYPDMAQYAATVQLRDRLSEMQAIGNKLYLFPIEIDEFYLIRYGEYLEKNIKDDGFWTDGKSIIPYNDKGVEALVEFRIPSEAIKRDSVKEIDIDNIPQFQYSKRGDLLG
jgi:hypothetical protein